MNKISLFIVIALLTACSPKAQQQQDSLYSRHLQRKVDLTIIHTPLPDDKSKLNLLLLNDGQELAKWRVQEITDSLYKAKAIEPLVIVAIHAGDRMQEYGVADKPDYGGRGSRAGYYDAFINNELYPYIKKKTGVRKFHSVAIAGASLGGLSAFDIGWNHADKIDKIGVFSGSFWWRDKDVTDSSYSDDNNRIMMAKLKASRKKPQQQYWFYAGGAEENSDRDKDGIIDVVDDTKDLIALLQKRVPAPGAVVYQEVASGHHDWPDWSAVMPGFMVWAFGGDK
ncbi:alpha/beta hydrolase [Paraflavitalea speifideaquila]|uniref:alpha/beta hydrolase n=1 Tax=Paraflavitalea speifideaquila TaxID=3076558 RepID=UPI0028EB9B2C|nr:alpha/beta hydrolase-fold protein [Paraflavitalea speifideiaquila]